MEEEQKIQVICPNCGAKLLVKNTAGTSQRVVTCPKCQHPIKVDFVPVQNAEPETPVAESSSPVQPQHEGNDSNKKGLLIGVLSGLVIVLAGLLLWFLVFKDKPSYSHSAEGSSQSLAEINPDEMASCTEVSIADEYESGLQQVPASWAEASTSIAPISQGGNYQELTGNIGPHQIKMFIDEHGWNDGENFGYYYYIAHPNNIFRLRMIDFECINASGSMRVVLHEYTSKGFHSGTFTGQYEGRGGFYQGTFVNSNGESFPFEVG